MLQAPDVHGLEIVQDSTWADDTAILLADKHATNIEAKLVGAAAIVIEVFLEHGLQTNMSKGKTEGMICFAGKDSRNEERRSMVDQKAKLIVPTKCMANIP